MADLGGGAEWPTLGVAMADALGVQWPALGVAKAYFWGSNG